MPTDLLATALAEASRATLDVRAAALMRLARVWKRLDPEEATRLFERGLADARTLPADICHALLRHAAVIGATVTPRDAMRLAEEAAGLAAAGTLFGKQVEEMLAHGLLADAIDYLSRLESSAGYPFDAAARVIGKCQDEPGRLAVLRGAMKATERRLADSQWSPAIQPRLFMFMFAQHWPLAPHDEAVAFVHRLVQRLVEVPDTRIRGSEQGVAFTSTREMTLFQWLGTLAHLDPALVESLKPDHREFAAAASRYPFGAESIRAERDRTAAPVRAHLNPSSDSDPIIAVVEGRPVTRSQALREEFDDAAFERAALALADDRAGPNAEPKDAWPSAEMYRRSLYWAAHADGPSAERLLDRIPDADLRLFARIEMAAAMAGLPEFSGIAVFRPASGGRQSVSPPPPPDGSPEARVLVEWMERARAQSQRSQRPYRRPDLPSSPVARIQRSTAESGAQPDGGNGPDFWVITGAPLRPVVARLYDMAPGRIDILPSLDTQRFDFTLILEETSDRPTMERLMREGLERTFVIRRERRAMDVHVLTAPAGITAESEDSSKGGLSVSTSDAIWTGTDTPSDDLELQALLDLHMVPEGPDGSQEAGDAWRLGDRPPSGMATGSRLIAIDATVTMSHLCELLEAGLDRPVVDETGLTGAYRVRARSNRVDDEATGDLLRIVVSTLGLVVTPARRDVDWLIVEER